MRFRALIILIYPDHSFGSYSSLIRTHSNYNSPYYEYTPELTPEIRSFSYYSYYRNHYKKNSKKSKFIPKDFFTNDKYLIDLDTFNLMLIPIKNKFRKFQSKRDGTKIFRIIKYYESGEIVYESEEIKR